MVAQGGGQYLEYGRSMARSQDDEQVNYLYQRPDNDFVHHHKGQQRWALGDDSVIDVSAYLVFCLSETATARARLHADTVDILICTVMDIKPGEIFDGVQWVTEWIVKCSLPLFINVISRDDSLDFTYAWLQ